MAEALAARLGASGVTVCPAFPVVGRKVYQEDLFVGDRLLSESGMEDHPLNPMRDADIRRLLARQTEAPIGRISHATVVAGEATLRSAFFVVIERGEIFVIVDATTEADVRSARPLPRRRSLRADR